MAATAPWQEDRKTTRIASRKDVRDKTTLISIYPKKLDEYKITVFPSRYVLEPGTLAKPSVLVIGPGSWWKDIAESNQLVEVNEPSIELAKSIIDDWAVGLLGFTAEARPGIFCINEELTAADALKKYPDEFKLAELRQKNYYKRLVDFADQIWSKTPNPAAIGDNMRMAARELGLETKGFLLNDSAAAMSKCPACGAARDTNYPMCGSCHTIVDPEKFKALGLVKA